MARPTLITVSGQFLKVDGTPDTGVITFASNVYALYSLDSIAQVPSRMSVALDANGDFTIQVPATNDPAWAPINWTYTLIIKLSDDYSIYEVSIPYDASGGDLSLAELLPTEPGSGPIDPGNYAPLVHTHSGEQITSGTIATGRLSVGTTAGTVAAGDHTHSGGGGTPIDPATTVVSETTYSQSPVVGTSALYARADHTHGTPALPTPGAIGAATAVHNHAASDVNSGVLDIARIPTGTSGTTTALGNHTHIGATGPLTLTEAGSPPTATPDILTMYAIDMDGNTVPRLMTPEGIVIDPIRDTIFVVRNSSGSTITKGTAVYPTGIHPGSGIIPTVAPARADNPATLPVVGLMIEDVANNSFGRLMVQGRIDGMNTIGLTTGIPLYLSATTAGAFTTTPPAHPNFQVVVGVAMRIHASSGSMAVQLGGVRGNEQGTVQNIFSIGTNTAGVKTLQFKNGFTGALQADPTAARTWTLPDTTATIGISNMVWNGSAYVEAPLGRVYIGPTDPGAVPDGSIWIDTDA